MSTQFGYRPSFSSPFFAPRGGHNIFLDQQRAEARAKQEAQEATNRRIAEARIARLAVVEKLRRAKLKRFHVRCGLDDPEEGTRAPTLAEIIDQVAAKHGLLPRDITKRRRHRKIVWARQEAMYRAYEETRRSLPEIGKYMGGFDHTTVWHGIHAHEKRMAAEGRL